MPTRAARCVRVRGRIRGRVRGRIRGRGKVRSRGIGVRRLRLGDLVSDLDLVCNLDLVRELEQPARP